METTDETIKKLKELNNDIKGYADSIPYETKLKDLEERVSKLENLLMVKTDVNKKQPSKGKPNSKKGNRVLPIKKLASRQSGKNRKVPRK